MDGVLRSSPADAHRVYLWERVSRIQKGDLVVVTYRPPTPATYFPDPARPLPEPIVMPLYFVQWNGKKRGTATPEDFGNVDFTLSKNLNGHLCFKTVVEVGCKVKNQFTLAIDDILAIQHVPGDW